MRYLFILFLIAAAALISPANATVSEKELAGFCAKAPKPATGQEFDGQKADPKVLSLTPGVHKTSSVQITLFPNNNYIVHLASGSEVAGCSKEQLSEVLRNNKISSAGLQ